MAVNSVPLGQAGTGAAFILGEDTASTNYLKNLANSEVLQRRAVADKQKQAEILAESYRKNALAASNGQLFANELGKLEQDHLRQGMDYRAQGWDVYNPNVNDKRQLDASARYAEDRRKIENLRAYRKGIEDRYKSNIDKITAEPEKYNREDIRALNDFVGGSLQDYYSKGVTVPMMRENFNLAEQLKGVKAQVTKKTGLPVNGIITEEEFVDADLAEKAVLNNLMSNSTGMAEIQKVTKGIPLAEIKNTKSTLAEIKKDLRKDIEGTTIYQDELAYQQIKFGTPAYDKWEDDLAKRLLTAKQDYTDLIGKGVSIISNGIPIVYKQKKEISEGEAKRIALSERNQNRLASGEGSGGSSTPVTQIIPFNYGKSPVRSTGFINAPLSTKSLAGSMESIDMGTGKVEAYNFNPNDDVKISGVGNFPFVVNATNPKLNGALAQPNFEDKNAVEYRPMMLVSVGSGDTRKELLVPYSRKPTNLSKKDEEAWSSFRPMSGVKGKTPTQQKQQGSAKQSKTVTSAQIKGLVGKRGYEGYSEKELADYYKSQGYTIK